MYTKRIEPLQSRILIALLLFTVFPICGFGKKKNVPPPVMDSIQAARFMDSIHRLYLNEVDFIIDRIENTYIRPPGHERRGVEPTCGDCPG